MSDDAKTAPGPSDVDKMLAVSRAMQDVAAKLNAELHEIAGGHVGFCLVAFTAGQSSYVSNCEREGVAGALRELLKHWEAGNPDVPIHEVH